MLAGCELLQRGGNGTGVTAVSRAILYTDSPVENNNTNVFFSACSHVARFIWVLSGPTHTFAHWCWAGSVTAGSRLEWHSIPQTAWGAVYTDKTLLYAHILHTCIIHSRHHELKEQQIQHTPNKTSITGTAETSVRWAAVGARVFHFLNKHACCFAEDF